MPTPRARPSPAPAPATSNGGSCSAGKGEGPVVTSVNAAYLQRNQRPVVSGLVVHPPGVVFQKPFSTGETEIAGYQADVLERRLANQGQPAPSTGAPTLGPAHLPEGAADAGVEGRRRQRRRSDLRRRLSPRGRHGLEDAGHRARRPDLRLGHGGGAERQLRGASRRQRRPSQAAGSALVGELESAVIEVDNTPPALTAGPVTRDGGRLVGHRRGARRPVGGVAARVLARRRAVAARLPGRRPARRPPGVGDAAARAEAAGRTLVVRAADALHNVGTQPSSLR